METYIIDMENHLGKITEGHSAEYKKKTSLTDERTMQITAINHVLQWEIITFWCVRNNFQVSGLWEQ